MVDFLSTSIERERALRSRSVEETMVVIQEDQAGVLVFIDYILSTTQGGL